jgi:hypothetical protein
VISNAVLVRIGLISYALYLVHWPIIVFWHYLADSFVLTDQVLVLFITFILAFLLHRYVEQPFRGGQFFIRRPIWKGGIMISLIFIFSIGLHAYYTKGWSWRIGKSVVNFEEVESAKAFHRQYYGGAGYPFYGVVSGAHSPDIVLVGDSHGRHYAEGLNKVIAEPYGYNLNIAAGTSCFHLPDFTRTTKGQDWDSLCLDGLTKAISYIHSSKTFPLVVLSHSWNTQMTRADKLNVEGERIRAKITAEDLVSGILDFKTLIGDAKLVVIGNVPRSGVNLYDIFTRPRLLMLDNYKPEKYLYSFRSREPKLAETNKILQRGALETGKYIFIDPFEYLCDELRCRNTDDSNRLIYSDATHLSTFGSIFLIKNIEGALVNILKSTSNKNVLQSK